MGERQERRLLRGLPFGKRTARGFEHFERADDALRIGGAKARGGERIAAGKLGVQRLRRLRLREKPVAGANLVRDVGNVGQPFRQRLEIEPRPADDDRRPPAPFRLVKRRLHIREPQRGGIRLARRPEPVKPVRRARLVGGCWPVRDDAQLGVNLHEIGVDDDAAKLARQFHGKRRLPARRRPADQYRSCVANRFFHPRFAFAAARYITHAYLFKRCGAERGLFAARLASHPWRRHTWKGWVYLSRPLRDHRIMTFAAWLWQKLRRDKPEKHDAEDSEHLSHDAEDSERLKRVAEDSERLRRINDILIGRARAQSAFLPGGDQPGTKQAEAIIEQDIRAAISTLARAGKIEAAEAAERGDTTAADDALAAKIAKIEQARSGAAKEEAALYRQRGGLAYTDDTQAALRFYAIAAETDPEDIEGLFSLAHLQIRAGNRPASKQNLERLIAPGNRIEDEQESPSGPFSPGRRRSRTWRPQRHIKPV